MNNVDVLNAEEKRDNLAFELLKEVKSQAKRWYTAFLVTICTSLLVIGSIVGGFIWYLNQYDYVSNIEQTGVYTFVDSQGNVISTDISPEQMKEILEIINDGKSKVDKEAN